MKIPFTLAALLFTTHIFTQSLEFTYWFASPTRATRSLGVLTDGKIIMAGTNDAQAGGFLVVDTFNVLHHAEVIGVAGYLDIQLDPTPDGGCFIAAYIPSCDFYFSGVLRYSHEWDSVLALWPLDLPYFWQPRAALSLDDGSFLFSADNHLYKISSTVTLEWVKSFTPPIKDIAIHANGILYAISDEGVMGINPTGDVLFTNTDYLFDKIAVHHPTGYIVGYQNSTLTVLDTDLEVISGYNFVDTLQILDVDMDSHQIAVLSVPIGGTENAAVTLADFPSFSNTWQFPLQSGDLVYDQLTLAGEQVLVAGRDFYNTNVASFVKSYTLDGTTVDHGTDASLVSVQLTPYSVSLFGFRTVSFSDVWVIVKNEGTDTLRSTTVALDLTTPSSFLCPLPQHISRTFEGLEILPGESAELEFGNFWANFYWNDTVSEMCFYTFLPNNKIDRNHSNDATCVTTTLVSACEKLKEEPFVKLSPNPVADVLYLSFEEPLGGDATLIVHDMAGRNVLETSVSQNDRRPGLYVGHLPAGMYIIYVRLGASGFVSQFVKK